MKPSQMIPQGKMDEEFDKLHEKAVKALEFILEWGGFDGGHHKQWTLDQVARILAEDKYDEIVANYKKGETGHETYSWDEGIAP